MAMFMAMSIFYSFYGRVFLDAGFYLNAARDVYQGRIPYRDFFFVQGPVYPYIYGLPLLVTGHRLLFARWISMIFGILSLTLAARIGFRSGGGLGAILTLAAIATVPSQAYFFSSVKLYALSSFMITAAFSLLGSNCRPVYRHSGALIFAVLSAATRLTLVPALLVVAIFVIMDNWFIARRLPWIPIMVGTATALLIAAPFILADRKTILYFLLGIHTSAAEGQFLFSFSKQLKVLAKMCLFYPVLTLSIIAIFHHLFTRRDRSGLTRLEWAMAAAISAVTAAHFTANWFSLGYQSVIIPLMGALTGGIVGRWYRNRSVPRHMIAAGVIFIVVAGFLSARNYIWSESLTVIRNLRFIAEVIEQTSPAGASIAACSAVFALEAGRPVAGAFGGAPFTYTPYWSDEQCRQYGGMNNRILVDMITRQEPGVLIFEKNSFSVGSPGFFPVPSELQQEIFDAIAKHYQQAATLRNLGNAELDLILYIPDRAGQSP